MSIFCSQKKISGPVQVFRRCCPSKKQALFVMDFLSIELKEEFIPGAKFNSNVLEVGREAATQWLKCRIPRKLSKLTLK